MQEPSKDRLTTKARGQLNERIVCVTSSAHLTSPGTPPGLSTLDGGMAAKLARYAQRVFAYHSLIRCVHTLGPTLNPWLSSHACGPAVRWTPNPKCVVGGGSLLAYVAGIGVLLALPMLAKVTYFSENALLTGAGLPDSRH